MHWSLWVIAAGVVNAFVNFGYKIQAAKDHVFLIAACVMAITSITLFSYVGVMKGQIKLDAVFTGHTPLVVLAMGIGSALIMILFVTGLAKGPISLVDPLLACVYAVVSVLIGLLVLRENPSIAAMAGIGCYLIGAFLMARG